ncbi:MAG: hypothetical protein GF350_07005, partial [Chitinivibrionales bacterium]|nr:hypothetical protein [Chitinivibrionales bacterium]
MAGNALAGMFANATQALTGWFWGPDNTGVVGGLWGSLKTVFVDAIWTNLVKNAVANDLIGQAIIGNIATFGKIMLNNNLGDNIEAALNAKGMSIKGVLTGMAAFTSTGMSVGAAIGLIVAVVGLIVGAITSEVGVGIGIMAISAKLAASVLIGTAIGAAAGATLGACTTAYQYAASKGGEAHWTYDYTSGAKSLMDEWADAGLAGTTMFELANFMIICHQVFSWGLASYGGFKVHKSSALKTRLAETGWLSKFTIEDVISIGVTVMFIAVTGGKSLFQGISAGAGKLTATLGNIVKAIKSVNFKGALKLLAKPFTTGARILKAGPRTLKAFYKGVRFGKGGMMSRFANGVKAGRRAFLRDMGFGKLAAKTGAVVAKPSMLKAVGQGIGASIKTIKNAASNLTKTLGKMRKALSLKTLKNFNNKVSQVFSRSFKAFKTASARGGFAKGIEAGVTAFARSTGLAYTRIGQVLLSTVSKAVGAYSKSALKSTIKKMIKAYNKAHKLTGSRVKAVRAAMRKLIKKTGLAKLPGGMKQVVKDTAKGLFSGTGPAGAAMGAAMGSYTLGAISQTLFGDKDFSEVFNRTTLMQWAARGFLFGGAFIGGVTNAVNAIGSAMVAQFAGTGMTWAVTNATVYAVQTAFTGAKFDDKTFVQMVGKSFAQGMAFHSIFVGVNAIGSGTFFNAFNAVTKPLQSVAKTWTGKAAIVLSFAVGNFAKDFMTLGTSMTTTEAINSLVKGAIWGVVAAYLVSSTGINHVKGIFQKTADLGAKATEAITAVEGKAAQFMFAGNAIAQKSIQGAMKWIGVSPMFTSVGAAFEGVISYLKGEGFSLKVKQPDGSSQALTLGLLAQSALHGATQGLWMGAMVELLGAGPGHAGSQASYLSKVAEGRLTIGRGLFLGLGKQVAGIVGQAEMVVTVTAIDKALSFFEAKEGEEGPRTGFSSAEKQVLSWAILFMKPAGFSLAAKMGKALAAIESKMVMNTLIENAMRDVAKFEKAHIKGKGIDAATAETMKQGELYKAISARAEKLGMSPEMKEQALNMAFGEKAGIARFNAAIMSDNKIQTAAEQGKDVGKVFEKVKGEALKQIDMAGSIIEKVITSLSNNTPLSKSSLAAELGKIKDAELRGSLEGTIKAFEHNYKLTATPGKKGSGFVGELSQNKAAFYNVLAGMRARNASGSGLGSAVAEAAMVAFKCGAGKSFPSLTAQLGLLYAIEAQVKAEGVKNGLSAAAIEAKIKAAITSKKDAKLVFITNTDFNAADAFNKVHTKAIRQFYDRVLGDGAGNRMVKLVKGAADMGSGGAGLYIMDAKTAMHVMHTNKNLLKDCSMLTIDEFESCSQMARLTIGREVDTFHKLSSGAKRSFEALDNLFLKAAERIVKQYSKMLKGKNVDAGFVDGILFQRGNRSGQIKMANTAEAKKFINNMIQDVIRANGGSVNAAGGEAMVVKALRSYVNNATDVLLSPQGGPGGIKIASKGGKFTSYALQDGNFKTMRNTKLGSQLASLAVTHRARIGNGLDARLSCDAATAYKMFNSSSGKGVSFLDVVSHINATNAHGAKSIMVGYGGTIEGCKKILGAMDAKVLDLNTTTEKALGVTSVHHTEKAKMEAASKYTVNEHFEGIKPGKHRITAVSAGEGAKVTEVAGHMKSVLSSRGDVMRNGVRVQVREYADPAKYEAAIMAAKKAGGAKLKQFLNDIHIVGELVTGSNCFSISRVNQCMKGISNLQDALFVTTCENTSSQWYQMAARTNIRTAQGMNRVRAKVVHFLNKNRLGATAEQLRAIEKAMAEGGNVCAAVGSIGASKELGIGTTGNTKLMEAVLGATKSWNARIDGRQAVEVMETTQKLGLDFKMQTTVTQTPIIISSVARKIVEKNQDSTTGQISWASKKGAERYQHIAENDALNDLNTTESDMLINALSSMRDFSGGPNAVAEVIGNAFGRASDVVTGLTGSDNWTDMSQMEQMGAIFNGMSGENDMVQDMVIGAFNDNISKPAFFTLAGACNMLNSAKNKGIVPSTESGRMVMDSASIGAVRDLISSEGAPGVIAAAGLEAKFSDYMNTGKISQKDIATLAGSMANAEEGKAIDTSKASNVPVFDAAAALMGASFGERVNLLDQAFGENARNYASKELGYQFMEQADVPPNWGEVPSVSVLKDGMVAMPGALADIATQLKQSEIDFAEVPTQETVPGGYQAPVTAGREIGVEAQARADLAAMLPTTGQVSRMQKHGTTQIRNQTGTRAGGAVIDKQFDFIGGAERGGMQASN